MIDARTVGIYLHIPFCVRKCAYCDFYSQTDYSLTDRYLDALLREAARVAEANPGLLVDTLYIGGGTPTSLSLVQLDRLLSALKGLFSLTDGAEITVEANPATLDEKSVMLLAERGVTRVSMGLQSANNKELATLCRLHSYEDVVSTFRLVKGRVPQVSLDLMFGLPEQSMASLVETLEESIRLSPDHISLYALKIEEGTPFARMGDSLFLPSEDMVADMYLYACRRLEEAGYIQYEISNFARQGCLSRHNYRYWKREDYIGLGPAAHSCFQGVRYGNERDIHAYMNAIEKGESPPLSESHVLTPYDEFCESIMLGLRLREGIDLEGLFKKHGYSMGNGLKKKLDSFVSYGYAERKGCFFALTPRGFLVSNRIIGEIIPDEN